MKKLILFAAVAAFSMNIALADEAQNFKVGVIDMHKVVASSQKVKSLKTDQDNKRKELETFINNARKEVAKEKDPAKKKALEAKYNKQLEEKSSSVKKDYAKKIQDIDKQINDKIEKQAKDGHYNLILNKGAVLYGGEDITEKVVKELK